MARRTSYLNVRIDPATKAAGNKVLQKVGLSPSDAISLFYKQVELHNGLPFAVQTPNAETRRAITEARSGKLKRYSGSAKGIFRKLLAQ